MSHILYDFLANSLFFDQASLDNDFADESDERIEKELIDYRSYVIDHLDELMVEINQRPSELNVFTSETYTPIDLLKQTALYLNQYVVADPLFRHTKLETASEQAVSNHLGFKAGLSKGEIRKSAQYLKSITPMVAGNFVKVFPVSYHFEPPKLLPLKIPVENNRNLLPKDLLAFFQKHTKVSPMEQLNSGGWAVLDGKELVPGRAINIEFEGTRYQNGFIYFLYESKILSVNEEERTFIQTQYLPPYPPSQAHFDVWIEQSVNSAARNYFDQSFNQVYLAEQMGAKYISDNFFKNELLGQTLEFKNDIKSDTITQMLNLDLPFLENVNVDKLMQVRENDADTFTNFRVELEKQFRELRLTKDEKDLKLKTENMFHELNDVQGQKINQRMGHIRKQMLINAGLAIGGLAASVTTGGLSLAGVAAAAAKGLKDYNDYALFVKENPGYFLWKSKDKTPRHRQR
jgi:hypothetical protein